MTQDEILAEAGKILDNKKAEDIRVIANGISTTHTKALADELEFQLKEKGVEPRQIQGNNGGGWIVMDYSDIVVHIFNKETRDFYNLERLWSDGKDIDVSQFLK